MEITVPESAYSEQVGFEISAAEIQSHTYGENITPVTPLISIDNGEVFASEPLEVQIPITLADDEFAMGFYYDDETGSLEGIPLLEETNSSITILTKHFSDIFIAKANEGNILGRALEGIETGFTPGKDDFIMENAGGYLTPAGHCAGQSIAELYYYDQSSRGGQWSGQLYGRFDNNGLQATPTLYKDDAKAFRLCEALQKSLLSRWNTGAEIAEYHTFKNRRDDEKTFYALAYAMMETGKPQLVYCARSNGDGAHMVIAYKIVNDTIYVADPNFPSDVSAERTITYDRFSAAANNTSPKLTPYYSAATAEEAVKAGKKPYDIIAYYGMYALVDKNTIETTWQTLLNGQDPGTGMFPADLRISVFQGLKETVDGNPAQDVVPITDGMVLYESRLKDTAASGGKLFLYLETQDAMVKDDILYFYVGDKRVQLLQMPSMPDFFYYELQPGVNDIGFLYEAVNPNYQNKGDRFVNFYRYTITYDNGAGATATAAPVTQPPEAASGFEGEWQMYRQKLLKVQGNAETMSILSTMFEHASGYYTSLEQYIESSNEDYAREPVDFDQRHLTITKGANGQYTAELSGYNTVTELGKKVQKPYSLVFNQVQVSGNTITFEKSNTDFGFTSKDAFELQLDGDTLTGTMICPFFYEPLIYYQPYPAGFNPEEVWTFEAVRVE